jgi:hypothetical protein
VVARHRQHLVFEAGPALRKAFEFVFRAFLVSQIAQCEDPDRDVLGILDDIENKLGGLVGVAKPPLFLWVAAR